MKVLQIKVGGRKLFGRSLKLLANVQGRSTKKRGVLQSRRILLCDRFGLSTDRELGRVKRVDCQELVVIVVVSYRKQKGWHSRTFHVILERNWWLTMARPHVLATNFAHQNFRVLHKTPVV